MRSDSKVSDFTEQHYDFDEQQERVGVHFGMICEDVRGEKTLGVVWNDLLECHS